MTSDQKLKNERVTAAECSRGISSEPIYGKFIELVVKRKIQGRVLDFGAGVGKLSLALTNTNQFSSITGIDLLERPTQEHGYTNWIQWDLNEKTPFEDDSFDAILSSEVIEHLENPRFVTREWYRILRPGGTLIFSTPNNESWRSLLSLLVQGHFVAFTKNSYPAHITALLREDIERILLEAGFISTNFVFTNDGGVPKLPHIKWQQISLGLLKGLRFSDNILTITKKPNQVRKLALGS